MRTYPTFCGRKWLDYCDENNDLLSERLTLEEYTTRYAGWLRDLFTKHQWLENDL